jgi:hypothetical protein
VQQPTRTGDVHPSVVRSEATHRFERRVVIALLPGTSRSMVHRRPADPSLEIIVSSRGPHPSADTRDSLWCSDGMPITSANPPGRSRRIDSRIGLRQSGDAHQPTACPADLVTPPRSVDRLAKPEISRTRGAGCGRLVSRARAWPPRPHVLDGDVGAIGHP